MSNRFSCIIRTFVFASLLIVLLSCTSENIVSDEYSEKMTFVDDNTFEFIRDAYNTVDFNITFESGDLEIYDFFISQFHRLVNLDVQFYERRTGRYFYLAEYKELNFKYFDPNEFMYLFFDMSNTGTPNLGITDNSRFTYIFSYDRELDRFILWNEIGPGYAEILGTRKIRWGGGRNPLVYTYVVLDEYANHSVYVRVAKYAIPADNGWGDTMYFVSMPEFLNGDKKQIPEDILQQAFTLNSSHEDTLFFRVSEEQFFMLAYPILNARPTVQDINNVTYSYSELFEINCRL